MQNDIESLPQPLGPRTADNSHSLNSPLIRFKTCFSPKKIKINYEVAKNLILSTDFF
jgi:hypothetical protein